MAAATTSTTAFPVLEGEQYVSLTTFRKNGTPKPTPIWFAEKDGKLYMVTQADSWKVKRLRNNENVTLAPCKANGEVTGDSMEATARIAPESDWKMAQKLLNKKYMPFMAIFIVMWTVRRTARTYIEVSPK